MDLQSATLVNTHRPALFADGATIAGGVFARQLRATGEVRAIGATIEGQLILSGATITNPCGPALVLNHATISAGLHASDNFIASGGLCALGATIGGPVDLTSADLTSRGKNTLGGCVLVLDEATLRHEIVFRDVIVANGVVRARGATIAGLDFSGVRLSNSGAIALDLVGAKVGTLRIGRVKQFDGFLNLSRSEIGDLDLTAAVSGMPPPPGNLIASGWKVRDVHGQIRTDYTIARRWLETTPDRLFSVQPWHEFAAVYDRNGQSVGARRLRFLAANKISEHAPWYSKPLRWTYCAIAGHGYYPLLAAVWLVAALMAALVIVSSNSTDFVHVSASGSSTPSLAQAGAIALANVVPAAGSSKPDWTIEAGASFIVWSLLTLRLAAWILVAILLAGVTGLLRKT